MEDTGTSMIPALVQRLRSGRRTAQLQAAGLVCDMARLGSANRQAIAAAGAIPILVQLLSSSSGTALRCAAARALTPTIAEGAEPTVAFIEAGGVPALLECLTGGADDERLLTAAARLVVGVLYSHGRQRDDAARTLAAGGAVDVLTRMLASGRQDMQAAACEALANFGTGPPGGSPPAQFRDAVLESGAMRLLAQCAQAGGPGVQLPATFALANIGGSSAECASASAAAGGAAIFVKLQQSSREAELQRAAAVGLCNLARHPQKDAIAAAGGIRCLVRWLATLGPGDELLPMAATALLDTLEGSPERSRMAAEAGAVPVLQRLQQVSDDDKVWDAAFSALSILTGAPKQPDAASSQPPARARRPPRVCAAPGCGATHDLRRCGGCGTVRYCSAACSRGHWREHRAECRRLQAEQAAAAAAAEGEQQS